MIQRKMLYACGVMVFVGAFATGTPVAVASDDAADAKATVVPSAEEVVTRATRLPASTPRYHVQYRPSAGQGGFVAGEGAPIGADDPVYVNEPPPDILFPPGPNRLIADDLVSVAVGGCSLTGYEVVVGRATGFCSIDNTSCETDDDCVPFGQTMQTCNIWEDPGFAVDFALYDGCPMNGGQLITGTDGSMSFEENGLYTVVVDFSDNPVFHPGGLWLGVEFDRAGAGWVVGTPASTGFTENIYDFPHPAFACSARFSGSPLYAGFHAKIFCSEDPPFEREFLAYFNPELTGAPIIHPANASNRFLVDDLTLIVDECIMTSYAVGVAGTSDFEATAELWSGCSPAQYIEGTRGVFNGTGDGSAEFGRFSFPEGIDLGSGSVYIGVKLNIANGGPIQANEATLGFTDATFGIFDWPGQGDGCGWVFTGNIITGFAASVSCLGDAPTGACCDLVSVQQPGDEALCREVTQIACSGTLTRYNQGSSCPNTCLVDNTPCSSDGDCTPMVCSESHTACSVDADCLEEGELCLAQDCVDLGTAFDPSCGTAACCTPPTYVEGEGCFDLTIDECTSILDNDDNPGVWRGDAGLFCDNPATECVRWICRHAEGNCDLSHGGIGCNDPICCNTVCDQDEWCCDVQWDQTCADRALDENFGCDLGTPTPDECITAPEVPMHGVCSGGSSCDIANGDDDCPGLEICNLPNIKLDTDGATASALETFCCSTLPGGSPGGGGVWAKFVAAASSIVITTEDGGPGDANDAVVELYLADDSSTPENACASLIQVGCDDDSGPGNQAELTVHGLSSGSTYYVLLAGKGAAAQGTYRVNFEYPAPDVNTSPSNDSCELAVQVTGVTSENYDLTDSSVACPIENCLPSSDPDDPGGNLIDNDVWYSYFPIFTGILTVDTCGTEDTAMVVYNTGACPPSVLVDRIACNDDGPGGCAPGSQISFSVTGGQPYLIRLSGINGSEPSGVINFSEILPDCNLNSIPDDEDIINGTSEDCNENGIPDECNDGCTGIVSSVPPTESIDAGHNTEPHGAGEYGLTSIVITFSGDTSGIVSGDFSMSTTTGLAPAIMSLISSGNDLTINFDGPLPVGGYTTITYTPSGEEVCVGYRPADVDESGTGDDADIIALIDHYDGNTTLPIWSTDIDRSGADGPEDLLRLIDLLNGGGNYDQAFGLSIVGTCN